MLISVILTGLICVSAIVGDILIQRLENYIILKALMDNATHAAIGGFTWCAVCFQRKIVPTSSEIIWQVVLCTLVASLTDVDHFLAAKSLKLQDVQLLKDRPFLHCTSLVVSFSFAVIFVSHLCSWQAFHTCGWILVAAFISHHTRDATRRGYWFCPFGSSPPIDYWIYITIIAVLPYIIAACFNISTLDKMPYKRLTNLDYSSLV